MFLLIDKLLMLDDENGNAQVQVFGLQEGNNYLASVYRSEPLSRKDVLPERTRSHTEGDRKALERKESENQICSIAS